MVPAGRDAGGHQHLDDFRKNEPVEAKLKRQRKRVREHGEPTETAGEEHQFRGQRQRTLAGSAELEGTNTSPWITWAEPTRLPWGERRFAMTGVPRGTSNLER